MKRSHLLFTALVCCFVLPLFAQQTVEIREFQTAQTIPFCKVTPHPGKPLLSDLNGSFDWPAGCDSVTLTSQGFITQTYQLTDVRDGALFLKPIIKTLEEMKAVPGENPAHRIMDQVIAKRKSNNPNDGESYRLKAYSKWTVEPNDIPVVDRSDTTLDSSYVQFLEFVDSSHFFMIETYSEKTFQPPFQHREKVLGYKVSGFQDPIFATILNEVQSFNFYESQFQLLSISYINPIALGGTNRYLFILEDTTLVGSDTVFHISFRPRKGKNFDGLKGMLYVNTNGFGVERVTAEPADLGSNQSQIKIIQEYRKEANNRWYPYRLGAEIALSQVEGGAGDSSIRVMSRCNTYIDSLQLGVDVKKGFWEDNSKVVVKDPKGGLNEEEWKEVRTTQLSQKEQNTYIFIDSLSKEANLDKYLRFAKILATGKIPLKWVNADLSKIMDFSEYERLRLGLGLETSDKIMKRAVVGGYFAYGFGDQTWKWGGFTDIKIYPPKQLQLRLAYSDDLKERGFRPYLPQQIGYRTTGQIRGLYERFMDRTRLAEGELSIFLKANMRLGLGAQFHQTTFLQGYSLVSLPENRAFTTTEYWAFPVNFLWNIREEVITLGDLRLPKESSYPKIYVSIAPFFAAQQGLQNFGRAFVEINQRFPIRGAGHFRYVLNYAHLLGDAPLTFAHGLYNSYSTLSRVNLAITGTIETLDNTGFFFTEFVGGVLRFDFNAWKKTKEFKPQISLQHGYFTGKAVPTNNGVFQHFNYQAQSLTHHLEAGLRINSLLNTIGIGFYYRYGQFWSPREIENFTLKITAKLN